MHIKTLLNRVHAIKGFVYKNIQIIEEDGQSQLEVEIVPDRRSRPICSECDRSCGTYDTQSQARRFEFVPIWGTPVLLIYFMRRVNCPDCGVKIERVPWAQGKHRSTIAMRCFLADWAEHLSWKTVAEKFRTSWDTVFRSVEWVVQWGLENRYLGGIESIGVDEVAWKKGHKYLTLVYQIDAGRKRLLWIGRDRTKKAFRKFFTMLDAGTESPDLRSQRIRYVCSDMWKPYLKVIAEVCTQAVNILDRFHVKKKLTEAVDKVRRAEAKRLEEKGYYPHLKKSRFLFLKNFSNLTVRQAAKLRDIVQYNLRTVRAWILKEDFDHFWECNDSAQAGEFLDDWCGRAMRSRLDPMQSVVGTLRRHRELLLNWFGARLSSGVVEGFNNKVKTTTRRAYGFRSQKAMEVALYHTLGDLPRPESTHRFC